MAQDYLDALTGVCYDGVEGLLYLALFSLLAACALCAMLGAIFQAWTQMGSRSVVRGDRPMTPPSPSAALISSPRRSTPATKCSVSLRRDKEYDDIDEEDPFNPGARRLSSDPRRSTIHSFCSYTSSIGSQAGGHPPAPQAAAAGVPPAPEYM